MSPEDRAREMLGMPAEDDPIDLADAIDLFASELDVPRGLVMADVAGCLIKAVKVSRLRRLTGVFVED